MLISLFTLHSLALVLPTTFLPSLHPFLFHSLPLSHLSLSLFLSFFPSFSLTLFLSLSSSLSFPPLSLSSSLSFPSLFSLLPPLSLLSLSPCHLPLSLSPFIPPSLPIPFFLTDVTAHSRAFFGSGRGPIFLDDLRCTGRETRLSSCRADRNTFDCSHLKDAGVTCSAIRK